jgi:hypothetical protein
MCPFLEEIDISGNPLLAKGACKVVTDARVFSHLTHLRWGQCARMDDGVWAGATITGLARLYSLSLAAPKGKGSNGDKVTDVTMQRLSASCPDLTALVRAPTHSHFVFATSHRMHNLI